MPAANISPHITEKSVALAKHGQYTFLIDKSLTAPAVASIVRSLYNVHPLKTSVLKNAAKTKGFRQTLRQRAGRAKAIVTVKKGEKIADFVIEESPTVQGRRPG